MFVYIHEMQRILGPEEGQFVCAGIPRFDSCIIGGAKPRPSGLLCVLPVPREAYGK
jgi:hypothetical protein